ncbi:hypothetical protein NUW54_g183 [Trametes sanguinea]|uniref:Uncharacterized protein n=1 Tax=Trametes sanguinea TaxID=158606 RepID=A0ACC1QCC2_9APHY|nr:hypothetical protein NUW54_g183 [Trametes sanguinea]
MSAAGSEYGGSTYERSEPRPDKPLVVKCVYEDRGNKKISYSNARSCTYDVLRKQIEKTYGLDSTPFHIAYIDDDTETIYITNEADLTEAINYFKPTVNDDAPLSSAASILSGRSFPYPIRVRLSAWRSTGAGTGAGSHCRIPRYLPMSSRTTLSR